jgi:sugar-specific transcriptional regulator TrmB
MGDKMNLKQLSMVLIMLGIEGLESQIYIFLVTNGSKKAKQISIELNLYIQQVYRSLKKLQKIGLVKKSSSRPMLFSAVPVEDLLNSFRESKLEEAEFLKENRDKLLSKWKTLIEKNSLNSPRI